MRRAVPALGILALLSLLAPTTASADPTRAVDGSSAAPSAAAAEPDGTAHAGSAHEGSPPEGTGAHAHHKFTDTEKWVRMFEDPKRAEYQKPAEVVAALKLQPGQAVGDIGAGSGYFAFPFASAVGPTGKVYAIDIEPGMLTYMQERAKREKVDNVVTVLADADSPHLAAASVDLIFICNTLHHIERRVDYLRRLTGALRPGGRIVVVDYHKKPLPVGPDVASKIARDDVVKEFGEAGFVLVEEPTFLPYQYFLIFGIAPR